MPTFSLYGLGASNISVSGGAQLSGLTQGDGSHLVGETITLDSSDWEELQIRDNDSGFADNDSGQRLNGAQSFDGISYDNNRVVEAEFQFVVEDPDGNQYTIIAVNIREPGSSYPAYGTVEGLAFVGPPQGWPPVGVPLTVVSAGEGPTGGSTGFTDYVTPCFTPGTLIDTPQGPRPVEALATGDLVTTLDDGAQPLRWVGQVSLGAQDLAMAPHLRPIRIRAGAFGAGRPARDLLVSPQHHILCDGPATDLMFGCEAALVAAKHLVDGRNVLWAETPGVTYIHLLFDRHQVVLSNGLPSESFFPGPVTLPCLTPPQQRELYALFPHLAQGASFGPAARPVLKSWEARLLAA